MTAETTSPENEKNVLRQQFASLVNILENIESEQAAFKDILTVLKNNHQIKPSVARKVAKRMFKDTSAEEAELRKEIDALYSKISTK
jgi:hypothetical protein